MDVSGKQAGQYKQLLRIGAVEQRIAFSRAHIYAMRRRRTFPAPIKIGVSSMWLASEVDDWVARRIAERDQAAA